MEKLIIVSDDVDENLQMLKKIKIGAGIPDDASIEDRGLYNLQLEGRKEQDLKKIYDFVQSIEMGCGFYSSHTAMLKELYDKTIKKDKDAVIKSINGREDVIDIINQCYCIQDEFKVEVLQSLQLNNIYVIFELIRQLLNNTNNALVYKEDIAAGIVKLASIDSKVFGFLIEKFEHKKQFYPVMGIALSSMHTLGRQVYAQSITISKTYDVNFNFGGELLQNIQEDRYDSFIDDVKEIICQRWEEYLSLLLVSKKFIPDIIINSYGDLILNCFLGIYEDKEQFFTDLDKAITQFGQGIYKWYKNESELSSMYYIYATKLYFLKEVQEINKISLTSRKDLYDKIRALFDNNYRIHHKYIKIEDIILRDRES